MLRAVSRLRKSESPASRGVDGISSPPRALNTVFEIERRQAGELRQDCDLWGRGRAQGERRCPMSEGLSEILWLICPNIRSVSPVEEQEWLFVQRQPLRPEGTRSTATPFSRVSREADVTNDKLPFLTAPGR